MDGGDVTGAPGVRLAAGLTFAGFCEEYEGHGGEDTDYGQQARAPGVPPARAGGAPAFHQHHPASGPPVAHVHDNLRNAETFHRRWGW